MYESAAFKTLIYAKKRASCASGNGATDLQLTVTPRMKI
jgi:hypothetical protein